MKFALLLLSYMLQDAGYPARLENGRCSACVRAGMHSKVYPGMCAVTAAACLSYYDEAGNWVSPKCNTMYCTLSCDRGHELHTVEQVN